MKVCIKVHNNVRIRDIEVDDILKYCEAPKGGSVILTKSGTIYVEETPEEINSMIHSGYAAVKHILKQEDN